MKKITRVLSFTLAVLMLAAGVFSLAACTTTDKTYYNNDEDKLVFSTLEVDGVFNPFYSTSGTDSNVVGMTQISMLTNDEEGNPDYGDDVATVTKDLQIITNELPTDAGQRTTYYFVLKNNVRFSNGSYLTIKDVLFNLYVYLDPAYTGSSTIYSTNIVGLQEYRTQKDTEEEQDSYDSGYRILARARIDALLEAAAEVAKEHPNCDLDEMINYLKTEWATQSNYKNVATDLEKAAELFKEELESDYSNSVDSYQDQKFYNKDGTLNENYSFTSDVEMFLYNEGIITWNDNANNGIGEMSYSIDTDQINEWKTREKQSATEKEKVKQEAIELVYGVQLPDNIVQILTYWNTANTLFDYIVGAEMEADTTTMKYENISGIKFANKDAAVTVNNKTYEKVEYDDNGNVKDGYNEVLSIEIENVDPKAIWNFSFGVAPMYYYSDAAHIAAFDYESNFGVEYKSQSWLEKTVKASDKIGVPVGAGPYAASTASGGIDETKISAGDFCSNNVIYFERNPYYILGAPKIKYVRYQVVSSNGMTSALYAGEVDYSEPNAKSETIDELKTKYSSGINSTSVATMGYGYIGINAGKIPSVYVRRAIMYSIDTSLTVSYYKGTAKPIYRSMSRESWAYPTNAVAYYPYIGGKIPDNYEDLADSGAIDADYAEYMSNLGKKGGETLTEEEQIAFIRWLLEDKAGYTDKGNGIYALNGNNECKFEFTIAGQETDHPAYSAMVRAGQLLEKAGFSITVKTDKNALSKLSNGSLTVWAAAWSSTIDPDMYQVYHKDSKATSVTNWGYKQILTSTSDVYKYEQGIINDLSDYIDEARTISRSDTEQEHRERAEIYSKALDLVMQLAVELPTYQRDDLFAYNYYKIDESTLNQNPTSLKGLTTDIHNISLVVEK